MHAGPFVTLEQVVECYNSGVQEGPLLDPRLRDQAGAPQRLYRSSSGKVALVAFMKTLTAEAAPAEGRFSNPFRR